MTAPVQIGRAQLYCGDALEVLAGLPAGSVDCVITDPPYDVHAGAGGGKFGNRAHLVETGGFTDGGCDFGFLDGYPNWFCFCSRKQLRALLAVAERCARYNVLTWCKPNPVPTCNNKYLPDIEFIVHGFSAGRLFGDMRLKSSFMVYPCGNKVTPHPNEKPLRLMSKLVQLGTRPGELVADFYMGSGTTGVAAVEAGRKFIGVESDPRWFDYAARRIEDAQRQAPLFPVEVRP